jgi:hypothetical protein
LEYCLNKAEEINPLSRQKLHYETLEQLTNLEYFSDLPKVSAWRRVLASRPSVHKAVGHDFGERLLDFFANRDSVIGRLARNKLSALSQKAA